MRQALLAKLVGAAVVLTAALLVGQSAAAATSSPFVDRSLDLPTAFPPPGFNGGAYTAASTGETVHIFSSPAYSADPSFNQRWADFIATMPHGPEISSVTVYFAPLSQVGAVCGASALGCYDADDEVIFTTGDDVPERATAQSIFAHEYGHHIANHEKNTPWIAQDYGTKRWASHVNVCKRARVGTLYPGDETEHYKLNSGEVFAETYRVLVEQKLGLPASPWLAVDPSLYPDAEALQLLAEDVASPWAGPTVLSRGSGFRPYTGDGRRFSVSTPLDGVLTLTLREPRAGAFDLELYDSAGGKLLARTTPGARPAKTVRYLICGDRSFQLRVVRTKGFGSFTLQISKP